MSIPAEWSVLVAVDSQGVRLMAADQRGDAACTLLKLTHSQAAELQAALMTARAQARNVRAQPYVATSP